MSRPRKRENQGLPQNLLCRKRKMKSGRVLEYFYYVMADGKETSLGTEKYEAVAEAARLNMEANKKSDLILFIEVAKRYELEIIPTKAENTQNANNRALKWLYKFFGDPPIPLEKIEPQHISLYLQWRKNTAAAANLEIALFNTIWNKAREWGYTKQISPSQGVKKYPVKFREIYMEDYLLEKLLEFADQQMKDIIQVAYLIGQRPIDICNIHRSHIYNGMLHITQKKTGKKVRFEIVGKLKEIIERRLESGKEWLFVNRWGRKLERDSLTSLFNTLRKQTAKHYPELEDEINALQLRDLRAKAATDLSLKVNDDQAQKTLGHSSQRMTQHYIRKEKTLKPLDEIISIKTD